MKNNPCHFSLLGNMIKHVMTCAIMYFWSKALGINTSQSVSLLVISEEASLPNSRSLTYSESLSKDPAGCTLEPSMNVQA